MASTSIVAAGESFDIGHKVILWDGKGGLSHYLENKVETRVQDRKTGKEKVNVISGKRYTPRAKTMSIDELRKEVINMTFHHAATWRAKDAYEGMHNSRKLSAHFLIDDDEEATIYQCLDIRDIGWTQGVANKSGPGVEIAWQPAAWDMPDAYSEARRARHKVPEHVVKYDTVHGSKMKAFAPTDAQVEAAIALAWGFCELFPGTPARFPRDKDGAISKTVIKDPQAHNGFLCHFNIDRGKIDPLAFPLKYLEDEVDKRMKFGY